jgi:hypothetical protein
MNEFCLVGIMENGIEPTPPVTRPDMPQIVGSANLVDTKSFRWEPPDQ